MLSWLIATLMALGWAPEGEAAMSQVHEDEVTLAALIAEVQHGGVTVAVVRLATPEHVARSYPVPGKGDKTCAPYDFIEYRATVEALLRAGSSHPKLAPGALSIVPANLPDLVHLAHLQCVDGVSKSPIRRRFPGVGPAPGARRIVFLSNVASHGWTELMSGAWLDAVDVEKIQRMLAVPSSPLDP